MIKCPECDFPRKFARFFDWRSDGTIISTDRTNTRSQITFLSSGEFEELFDKLSGTIGVPVEHFIVEAQKNIGKALYANLPIRHMKRVPSNRFFRPQWMAKLLVTVIAGDIAGLGDGRVSVDSYRAGDHLDIRFKNPCVNPMLVGSSLGIYESIEEMPSSTVQYGVEAGDLLIRMRHGVEKPESESRLYLDEVVEGEGPMVYERCKDCGGAPLLAAKALEWDLAEGIIRNRMTGEREVIVSVDSVRAILRELENELGEDVLTVLYDIQKDIENRRLEGEEAGDVNRFWEWHLTNLALRGLGYPLVFERGDEGISVQIGNAYHQVLYAAKIAAAFEKATGRTSQIRWKLRDSSRGSYDITSES